MTHKAPILASSAAFTVRQATEDDIAEMVEVINAAFDEENFFANRPRTNREQLVEHFRSGYFLLAYKASRLISSVYYELKGERGYVGMLAVHPNNQGCGIGRTMMQAAENMLRDHGCKVAEIYVVSVRTALLPIYRKMGYQEAGTVQLPEELREKLTMPIELIRMEKQL
ncbi:MAG: hypothetical protein CXZ00_07710 [Acidobacteria bacterium]|nr:MAG: hypothetical protein CXZ00_07710 [Acidobacteriota bacterium]